MTLLNILFVVENIPFTFDKILINKLKQKSVLCYCRIINFIKVKMINLMISTCNRPKIETIREKFERNELSNKIYHVLM